MPVEQSLSPKAKKRRKNKELRQHRDESKGEASQTELHSLLTDTQSPSKIDFIKLLPSEIRELILLYLDCRALTAACCVNKTWYKLIAPCSRVWRKACRRLDLIMRNEEEERDDQNYWKTLFLQTYKRRCQMSSSQSFVHYTRSTRVPLTAIYYHNGKLATASAYTTKIKIWECATYACLLTVKCNSWISSIKFDDFIIMAATDHLGIQSWDVELGFLKCIYLSVINFVSCFDYAMHINLVAGGFHNNSIHIWEMSTAEKKVVLNDHSSAVTNMMLRSHIVEEDSQEQQTLLISMDKEAIIVRFLSLVSEAHHTSTYLKVVTCYKISFEYRSCVPRRFAPKVGHYVRLIAQSSNRVLPLNPKCIFTDSCKGFLSSVFKFDGEFLYFAFQGDTVSLCKWDLKSRCVISNAGDKPGKIKAMLGAGRVYMTFISSWENEELVLLVVDQKRKKTMACIPLPMNAPDEPVFEPQSHRSNLCLGEESWLDGFDSKNDQGVVLVAAPESTRLFMLEWKSEEW